MNPKKRKQASVEPSSPSESSILTPANNPRTTTTDAIPISSLSASSSVISGATLFQSPTTFSSPDSAKKHRDSSFNTFCEQVKSGENLTEGIIRTIHDLWSQIHYLSSPEYQDMVNLRSLDVTINDPARRQRLVEALLTENKFKDAVSRQIEATLADRVPPVGSTLTEFISMSQGLPPSQSIPADVPSSGHPGKRQRKQDKESSKQVRLVVHEMVGKRHGNKVASSLNEWPEWTTSGKDSVNPQLYRPNWTNHTDATFVQFRKDAIPRVLESDAALNQNQVTDAFDRYMVTVRTAYIQQQNDLQDNLAKAYTRRDHTRMNAFWDNLIRQFFMSELSECKEGVWILRALQSKSALGLSSVAAAECLEPGAAHLQIKADMSETLKDLTHGVAGYSSDTIGRVYVAPCWWSEQFRRVVWYLSELRYVHRSAGTKMPPIYHAPKCLWSTSLPRSLPPSLTQGKKSLRTLFASPETFLCPEMLDVAVIRRILNEGNHSRELSVADTESPSVDPATIGHFERSASQLSVADFESMIGNMPTWTSQNTNNVSTKSVDDVMANTPVTDCLWASRSAWKRVADLNERDLTLLGGMSQSDEKAIRQDYKMVIASDDPKAKIEGLLEVERFRRWAVQIGVEPQS